MKRPRIDADLCCIRRHRNVY